MRGENSLGRRGGLAEAILHHNGVGLLLEADTHIYCGRLIESIPVGYF